MNPKAKRPAQRMMPPTNDAASKWLPSGQGVGVVLTVVTLPVVPVVSVGEVALVTTEAAVVGVVVTWVVALVAVVAVDGCVVAALVALLGSIVLGSSAKALVTTIKETHFDIMILTFCSIGNSWKRHMTLTESYKLPSTYSRWNSN